MVSPLMWDSQKQSRCGANSQTSPCSVGLTLMAKLHSLMAEGALKHMLQDHVDPDACVARARAVSQSISPHNPSRARGSTDAHAHARALA